MKQQVYFDVENIMGFVTAESLTSMLIADPAGCCLFYSIIPLEFLKNHVKAALSFIRVRNFKKNCQLQSAMFCEYRQYLIQSVQENALDWMKYLKPMLIKCGEQMMANPPVFVSLKGTTNCAFKIVFNNMFWFHLETAFIAYLTLMDILMLFETGRLISVSQAECYGSYPTDSVFVSRKTFFGVERIKPGFGWRRTGEDLFYVFSLAGYYHTQTVFLMRINKEFTSSIMTGEVMISSYFLIYYIFQ